MDDLSEAKAATEVAKDEEAKALYAYETARGETKYALKDLTKFNGELKARQAEELNALNAKNLAQTELTDVTAWHTRETARILKERKSLDKVIDILLNLPKSFVETELPSLTSHLAPIVPSLIEAAKADPAAVSKVIELVEDLIKEGERLQTKANADLATAEKTFADADKAHKQAVSNTLKALNIRDAAQSTYDDKLKAEAARKATYDAAQTKTQLAVEDQDRKQKISDTDVPVIDHEDTELGKVISILKKYQ